MKCRGNNTGWCKYISILLCSMSMVNRDKDNDLERLSSLPPIYAVSIVEYVIIMSIMSFSCQHVVKLVMLASHRLSITAQWFSAIGNVKKNHNHNRLKWKSQLVKLTYRGFFLWMVIILIVKLPPPHKKWT